MQSTEQVKELNLKFKKFIGIYTDQNWQEESLFIINCTLKEAHKWAFTFGQLAFVYGKKL